MPTMRLQARVVDAAGNLSTADIGVGVELPSGSSTTREPDIEETFSSYLSTEHLRADPRRIYIDSEEITPGRITLDTSIGYGDSDRSMCYTLPAGRDEFSVSRALELRHRRPNELWVEAVVRFDRHFTLSGSAYKLLHIGLNGPGFESRFGINFENGVQLNAEGPHDQGYYQDLWLRGKGNGTRLFDGRWHVVRYHVRLDGQTAFHEFWVDGEYQGSRAAPSRGQSFWAVILGRNLNRAAPSEQRVWWGRVRVWFADPGWGS